jgi:predicted small metal-binding protein
MTRKYVDCREQPSETNCTVALSADTEEELVEACVQHAVAVHGHKDTPEFRAEILKGMKEGSPPA